MPVVALCMPIARDIHPDNFLSYRMLQRDFLRKENGGGWAHFELRNQPVDVARNLLTQDALLLEAQNGVGPITHLFWVDDDMVYPPHSLRQLLAHDLPVVGGLCFDRRHPYKPILGRDTDPSWGYDKGSITWLYDYPPGALVDVDYTGGAFLLVKREVFEAISAEFGGGDPKWHGWWDPLPGLESEDLSFCERARRAGFSIKVDTALKIGHIGEVEVNEAFAKRNRAFEYNAWLPPARALIDAAASRDKRALGYTGGAVGEMAKHGYLPGHPVASIIVTAYNPRPEFFRAAVRSALSQTVPCEVIVVDDGSTPPVSRADCGYLGDTPNATDELVRVIRHEKNRGISAALNTGIEAMTTDWFSWLPCDDIFEPAKVELQLASLLATRRLCGYHGYNLSTDNKNGVGHVPTICFGSREDQNRILARNCAINGTTVMIHRSVFDKVGLFDEGLRYAQDWEMWNRIGQHYDWFGTPDKLATRREFENLTAKLRETKNPRKQEEDELVMAKYAQPALGPWPELKGYHGSCLACSIEADIGGPENPHPVPPEFHTCTGARR